MRLNDYPFYFGPLNGHLNSLLVSYLHHPPLNMCQTKNQYIMITKFELKKGISRTRYTKLCFASSDFTLYLKDIFIGANFPL